jgi:hypothetical protein
MLNTSESQVPMFIRNVPLEQILRSKSILVNPWVLSHDRKDGIEVVSVDDFLDLPIQLP